MNTAACLREMVWKSAKAARKEIGSIPARKGLAGVGRWREFSKGTASCIFLTMDFRVVSKFGDVESAR